MRFRGVGMALAAALAWLTAFAMPGGPVQAAGKNASPRIPVVLVHGMSSSPSAAWGVPETDDPEGRGFYRALRHAGYEPGRTLFWLDYSDVADGDFTEIAQRRLRPLVAHVLRTSGAPAVDLVTHSMGGLVARHFLAVGGAGLVRTLVMIAPPNRGSFAADLFQEAAAVQALSALQPAIRFRLPSQPDLGALEAPFQGELPYVVRVARDVFHPLYLRFVENLFLASPAQRGRPVAFTSWLAGEHPDVYQHAWTAVRVQVPPVADARPMGGVDAGTYLTRAYFHDLAARAVAAVFAAGKAAGADGPPPGDRPASGSGRASVGSVSAVTPSPWGSNGTSNGASGPLGFLLAVVRRAWSQVVESVGEVAAIWGHGAVIAGARSLLGLQPGAPAVNRMVPERVIIPAPSTPAEVLANAGLDWLNRTDAAAAPQRAERYVTVVGVAADWWRWLRNDVGDNDLVVEVSSSLLPAGPLDRFAVFRATHSGLLTEPAVQRYVLDRLAADGEGRAVLRPVVVPADGVVEARLDGPIWVPLVPPAGGPVTVFLRAEGLDPHRFRLGGFAARPRGDGLLQLLRPLRHAGPDGTLELRLDPADGAEQWVGVRIDPVEGAPTPTELRDGRAWRVAYEILAAPPPPAVASSPSVVPPPEEGAWPATAAGAGTGQVPRVQVVYRNKHTTLEKEKRTVHQSWEWDFGDGSRWVDEDPDHVEAEVVHTFGPGTHRVRAVSRAADGEVLASYGWTVTVAPGETATRTFRAGSLVEPVPVLRLTGPRRWITGRPARFELEAHVPQVPGLLSVSLSYDPGRVFEVQWRRPGRFRVQGAVTVRARYRLGEVVRTVVNTYVTETEVEVLATTVVD